MDPQNGFLHHGTARATSWAAVCDPVRNTSTYTNIAVTLNTNPAATFGRSNPQRGIGRRNLQTARRLTHMQANTVHAVTVPLHELGHVVAMALGLGGSSIHGDGQNPNRSEDNAITVLNRELFFLAISPGRPKPLNFRFSSIESNFGMLPDGRRFVIRRPSDEDRKTAFIAVINRPAEWKK